VVLAVEKFVNHRFFLLVFVLLVVITHVPPRTLTLGYDDYLQYAVLKGSGELFEKGFEITDPSAGVAERLKNGFHFFNSKTGTVDVHREYGNLPWWSVEEGIMQPYRPLAAATHWFDHNVLNSDLYWMQWHSILYFALFAVCGCLFYKHLCSDPLVYGIAAFMLVFDLSVSSNLNWLAARNSYLAVAFGLMALYGFMRWRETNRWAWFSVAIGMLIVGLGTAEATVAILGYFGGYALFMDKKGWFKGCVAVIPFILVVAVWRVLYSVNHFGAKGIGLYLDPGRDLLGFVAQVLSVVPVIGTSQILGLDNLVTGVSLDSWGWLQASAWLIVAFALFLIRNLILTTPLIRFLVVGALLAAIPHASLLSAGSRSGTFVSVGFFFVVAYWIAPFLRDRTSDKKSKAKRYGGWFIVVYHVVLPVLVLALFSWRIINIAYVDDGRYSSVETTLTSDTSLVVVNHGAPNQLFYLPYEWYYKGYTLPQSVKALVPGLSSFELERITERKFSIKSIAPLVVNHQVSMINDEGNSPILSRAYSKRMLQGLITHPNTRFFKDQTILQNDMRITIVAVEGGVPKELIIEFFGEESPENMVWQWYDWSDKMYKRMSVPGVGDVKRYLGPLAKKS